MRRRRYATVAIVFITQREWRVTYLASYEVNVYLWFLRSDRSVIFTVLSETQKLYLTAISR